MTQAADPAAVRVWPVWPVIHPAVDEATGPVVPPSDGTTMRRIRIALIGVAALLLAQANWVRRHHGLAPPPDPRVDLLVHPPDGTPVVGRPYRLSALGDSGMSGVGAGDLDGVLPVQVAQRLASALGRTVHVTSHARAGARTADVLREQVPRLTAADGVVLLVGTNDVLHGTPLPAVRRQTAELLDALVAAGPPVFCAACRISVRCDCCPTRCATPCSRTRA